MEEASISQDNLVKDRFPTVVDTDDLIFELGKQTVKQLNLEKLLTKLLERVKGLETQLLDVAKQQSETLHKHDILAESNALYEVNNRKLDAELVKQGHLKAEEIKSLKDELSTMTDTLLAMSEEVVQLKQKKQKKKKTSPKQG